MFIHMLNVIVVGSQEFKMVGALLGYAYGASITLKLHQNALSPKPFHNPQLGYNKPSLERIVANTNSRGNVRRRNGSLRNGKRDSRLSCSSDSNFTDTFRDAGIEVVKSLEEAETQSLKAVSEVEDLLAEADKGEPPHDSKKKVATLLLKTMHRSFTYFLRESNARTRLTRSL